MNGIDINEEILFDYLSFYFSNYLFSRIERVMYGVKNQIEIIEKLSCSSAQITHFSVKTFLTLIIAGERAPAHI